MELQWRGGLTRGSFGSLQDLEVVYSTKNEIKEFYLYQDFDGKVHNHNQPYYFTCQKRTNEKNNFKSGEFKPDHDNENSWIVPIWDQKVTFWYF